MDWYRVWDGLRLFPSSGLGAWTLLIMVIGGTWFAWRQFHRGVSHVLFTPGWTVEYDEDTKRLTIYGDIGISAPIQLFNGSCAMWVEKRRPFFKRHRIWLRHDGEALQRTTRGAGLQRATYFGVFDPFQHETISADLRIEVIADGTVGHHKLRHVPVTRTHRGQYRVVEVESP